MGVRRRRKRRVGPNLPPPPAPAKAGVAPDLIRGPARTLSAAPAVRPPVHRPRRRRESGMGPRLRGGDEGGAEATKGGGWPRPPALAKARAAPDRSPGRPRTSACPRKSRRRPGPDPGPIPDPLGRARTVRPPVHRPRRRRESGMGPRLRGATNGAEATKGARCPNLPSARPRKSRRRPGPDPGPSPDPLGSLSGSPSRPPAAAARESGMGPRPSRG